MNSVSTTSQAFVHISEDKRPPEGARPFFRDPKAVIALREAAQKEK